MNRLDLLKTSVDLLYTPKTRDTMGPYYAKEGAEDLLGIYICEDEYRKALQACGYTPPKDSKSFQLTERFPLEWIRKSPETRPKGYRKAQWEAYLHATKTAKEVVDGIVERSPLHPSSSRSLHITAVVGEHL